MAPLEYDAERNILRDSVTGTEYEAPEGFGAAQQTAPPGADTAAPAPEAAAEKAAPRASEGELLDYLGTAKLYRVRFTDSPATPDAPAQVREYSGYLEVDEDGAVRFQKVEQEEGGTQ